MGDSRIVPALSQGGLKQWYESKAKGPKKKKDLFGRGEDKKKRSGGNKVGVQGGGVGALDNTGFGWSKNKSPNLVGKTVGPTDREKEDHPKKKTTRGKERESLRAKTQLKQGTNDFFSGWSASKKSLSTQPGRIKKKRVKNQEPTQESAQKREKKRETGCAGKIPEIQRDEARTPDWETKEKYFSRGGKKKNRLGEAFEKEKTSSPPSSRGRTPQAGGQGKPTGGSRPTRKRTRGRGVQRHQQKPAMGGGRAERRKKSPTQQGGQGGWKTRGRKLKIQSS